MTEQMFDQETNHIEEIKNQEIGHYQNLEAQREVWVEKFREQESKHKQEMKNAKDTANLMINNEKQRGYRKLKQEMRHIEKLKYQLVEEDKEGKEEGEEEGEEKGGGK